MIHTFFISNLLWTEGIAVLGMLLLLGIVITLLYPSFLYSVAILFCCSLYFFRNPERMCSAAHYDATLLVCPSDGTIAEIVEDQSYKTYGCTRRVSIFLSPLDVHVMWIPASGTIADVRYHPGKFLFSWLSKSSALNERNDIILSCGPLQKTIVIRQIAGMVARRISCWVNAYDTVCVGQKYGMIRFGSRVDVFVPADVQLNIGLGQHVYGGETLLGRWL